MGEIKMEKKSIYFVFYAQINQKIITDDRKVRIQDKLLQKRV